MSISRRAYTMCATIALAVVAVVAVEVYARTQADAAAPPLPLNTPITGAWYVDTVGAPFEPHGITFHGDGTVDLTNPDAAEATNSSSAGMGTWQWIPSKNGAVGRFFEVNADKTTNRFTSLLVVDFEFVVNGDTFTGPATARYFDGNRNLIMGPFPAILKGQRFTINGPIPDPDSV